MLKASLGRLIGPLFFDYFENADGTRLRIVPKSKWARDLFIEGDGKPYREIEIPR